MGSSWIVVPFFFVPVPARSLAPFLGSARRDVLGENSRGLPRRQHPMNDRRKTQAIWVSPLLITNRLVSHKLARWDRCAPRTPSSSASTFRNRSAAHKYETRGQLVFASEIEYGQVDERRSHVPLRRGGNRRKKVSLYDVDFCSPGASTRYSKIPAEGWIADSKGYASPRASQAWTDRKNSLRSARVHQPGFHLTLLLFFVFSKATLTHRQLVFSTWV